MQKIVIRNFAAIQSLTMEVDNSLNVVIGAQASGKSTVAKTVYFCRKLRDYLRDYIGDNKNFRDTHKNEQYLSFLKFIRRQFMGCFGTTKHMQAFHIKYYYYYDALDNNKERSVALFLDGSGYVKIEFSDNLSAEIRSIIAEANSLYHSRIDEITDDFLMGIMNELQTRQLVLRQFSNRLNEIFADNYEVVYVPAGRSILAALSEQLNMLDVSSLDLPLQEFIQIIEQTKKRFGSKIPDMISDYTKTVSGQINNQDVDTAYKLIREILKGDYVNDKEGEKIFYNKNHWVKLMYASSGQQEVLWILLLVFVKILNKTPVFLVLEEPEAHLFPDAQKTIVELLALLINSTNSQVFATTHSPYILTSVNLLAYSGKVEGTKPTREAVVPRHCRIHPEKMQAFFIENSGEYAFTSIKDEGEMLIDATKIDAISDVINRETERLIDLEVANDL